jgi:malonyl CoA-acyl carrier protein transacylase
MGIESIELVTFNLKGSDRKRYGVIAQEVENNYPELVYDNEGKKTVAYIDFLVLRLAKLEEKYAELKKELDKISINSKNSIVIKNLDGKYYEEKDNISEILAKHIMNPVRFTECLKTMYESGIDTFIEIGPGKTLSGFVKRMKFENVKIMNINNVQSLEQVIKEVKENG